MKFIKKCWFWLGNDNNHNALTIIITTLALFFGLPYFSHQIYSVQVKVDSLQASIDAMYGKYMIETFCYEELKNSFRNVEGGKIITIKLKNKPIRNSVNIWEGANNVNPLYFKVIENNIELESNFNEDGLKEACSSFGSNGNGFKYTVTYIPSL